MKLSSIDFLYWVSSLALAIWGGFLFWVCILITLN